MNSDEAAYVRSLIAELDELARKLRVRDEVDRRQREMKTLLRDLSSMSSIEQSKYLSMFKRRSAL